MSIVSKDIATLNSGEQDPALLGRWDTEQFFKGASKLRNCYSLVTGGIVRRPGLEYVDDLQGTEPIVDRSARFIPYLDGGVDTLTGKPTGALIVVSFSQIRIYNVPSLTVAATIVDSTYNFVQGEITWTQKTGGDDIIIFHPAKQPRRLSIATGTWVLTTLAFESIPQHNFADTVVGSVTSHEENLKCVNIVPSDRITIFIDGVETAYIFLDAIFATAATNIKDAIEALPNIAVGDVTVTFIGGSYSSGANFDITLAGSVDGRRFTFTPGQIDEQNTVPDAFISYRTETKGAKKKEDIWSGTSGSGGSLDRGWPRCGAFFGNRLFMAGSPALGNGAWGSRINNAEDFIVLDDPTDDSPIQYFTDTELGATFNQAFVGRHLQFFASNTEFYEPNSDTTPLTPTNFTLRAATSIGAMRAAPILFLEGSSLFLQRDGRALRRYIFDESEQNYVSPNVSLRGGHLLNVTPIPRFTDGRLHSLPINEMALQRSRDSSNPDRIYIINEAGNLICVVLNADERVLAWHQWQTKGLFTHVAVVGDDVFVGVWREESINTPSSEPAHFIERFDSRLLVDSAAFDFSITPPIAVSTDMTHLEAGIAATNAVESIVDGTTQGLQDFTGTDTVAEFDPSAQTDWQVGLQFPDVKGGGEQLWIRTLPMEIELLKRILMGGKKTIVSAILRLLDTGSVEIDGSDVPLLDWIEAGDLTEHRQTGDFEKTGLNITDKFGQIDITQSKSDHLHLLALKIIVDVEDEE